MEILLNLGGGGRLAIRPSTLLEEVRQNCEAILGTRKGEAPLYRGFGLDTRSLDKPERIAETMLAADITAAIEEFEPRAVIKGMSFITDGGGGLAPRVIIEVEEDG